MWLEFLSEFDFEIKHVKNKEKKVVDALNKKFHVATMSICKDDLRERVIKNSIEDDRYTQMKISLRERELNKKYEGY